MKYQLGSKSVLLMLVLSLLASTLGCSQVQQAQTKAQRVPLGKHRREYKSPVNYAPREIGYDRKTGKPISYDHKPRIEMLDQKSGRYLLKWIGYDGKEKTVVFQRGDAVDVIVNASASKTSQGYLYSYQAANLPSSDTYLSGFILQNYAQDARPY